MSCSSCPGSILLPHVPTTYTLSYCGHYEYTSPRVSKTNELWVSFDSNNIMSFRGFIMAFESMAGKLTIHFKRTAGE